MAESVVYEGLCRRISGSLGTMWPSQWFMRVYMVASVVREDPCGRVNG